MLSIASQTVQLNASGRRNTAPSGRPWFGRPVSQFSWHCSGHFYHTTTGWMFGTNPGRVLAKTTWRKTGTEATDGAWLRGVLMGLEHTASYVPLLRVVVPRLLALLGHGPSIKPGRDDIPKLRARKSHTLTIEGLGAFCARYGLTPTELLQCELELERVSIATLLSYRVVRLIASVDCGDESSW
jgi:hypothetical protein